MSGRTNGAKISLGETWYEVQRYSSDMVREYTVTKHTSLTVWYKQKDWEGKETGRITQARKGSDWFQTKRDALAEKRRRLELEVEQTNASFSRATKALKDFNAKYAGELG